MKRTCTLLLAGCLALALVACKENKPAPAQQAAAPAAPAAQQPAAAPAGDAQGKGFSGKVVETVDSGGYTYVQIDTGSEKVWAAAPQVAVKAGDPVAVPPGMAMKNYHSKTLNRDFDVVYFVEGIMVGGAEMAAPQAGQAPPAGQMPNGHPPINTAEKAAVDVSGVKKADGGKTVQEIFAGKADLNGKEVKVRGKVVKFSPQIMGKNWLHIQDGTGGEGSNDLTVTTTAEAKVGDTVLVTGTVATDKDFGYGYKYPVILDNAKIVVE